MYNKLYIILIISVLQLERYAYICDLYLSYGNSVILVGDQGSGKTSFVKVMLQIILLPHVHVHVHVEYVTTSE